MLSFEFTPTKSDYIKSFQAYYLNSWGTWGFLILATILLGGVALWALMSGELRDGFSFSISFVIPLIGFVFLSFFLLYILVINPLKIANKVEKDERLHSLVQYEVSDEQILFKNQFTETKTDWGSFQKIIETEEVFLLVYVTNKGMFQFIPKRAFASREDEQTFKQLFISKNLKNKSTSLNIKNKPLLIAAIIVLLCCFLCICAGSFWYTILRSM